MLYPSKAVFFLKLTNFLNIAPKRWCKNCYHVNHFSDIEIECIVYTICYSPRAARSKSCGWTLFTEHEKRPRAQRVNCFNTYLILRTDCISKRACAARKIYQVVSQLFSILLTNRTAYSYFVRLHKKPQKVCVGKMQNPGHPRSVRT